MDAEAMTTPPVPRTVLCEDRIPVPGTGTGAETSGATPRNGNRSVSEKTLVVRNAAQVIAKPINWLWPGRIARGKVTLIAGHPGLGKSQVTASLAAIVSAGRPWPTTDTACPPGNVIFLSAEDDAADTIRPRLDAAGADVSRVYIVESVRDPHPHDPARRRGFSLQRDLPLLEAALADIGSAALIVIDPITAYLGEVDSHKNAEIRALLTPLSDLASRYQAAVVAVSHLNKSSGSEALQRVTGSLAFVAAARAAYIVARDKEDASRRVFVPIKNNIGSDQSGFAFSIESVTLNNDIQTSTVSWENEPITITADEALSGNLGDDSRSQLDDAKGFLRGLLADGPLPVKRVRAEADDAGHTWATIRRAQKDLGIDAYKAGMKEGWRWQLPTKVLTPS